MKLLFRRKADGRILKPIQTLDSYVHLQNAAGNRVWRAPKHTLPQFFDVLTHEIVNRFDAVTNAQRHAQEYGVGFIRVEQDGSMNAIDPRSVILK